MAKFSKRSASHLATAHESLQIIALDAIKMIDFAVIECHRGEERQNQLFKEGKSKAKWPNSKHNTMPSQAMDLAPIGENGKIDWDDPARFYELGDKILAVADFYQIAIRWGKDFRGLVDLPHFELVMEKKNNDISDA